MNYYIFIHTPTGYQLEWFDEYMEWIPLSGPHAHHGGQDIKSEDVEMWRVEQTDDHQAMTYDHLGLPRQPYEGWQ